MSDEDKKQISLDLDQVSPDSPDVSSESKITGPSDILEWVSHPAKRNLKITAIVTLFLISLVIIVYYMTYSVWFTILAILILFGSLASFYFPTRYKFTPDDITVTSKAKSATQKWSRYRSYYPDKNGVLLSTFARPTRLENFRGLYIRFSENREDVLDFVKKKIKVEDD